MAKERSSLFGKLSEGTGRPSLPVYFNINHVLAIFHGTECGCQGTTSRGEFRAAGGMGPAHETTIAGLQRSLLAELPDARRLPGSQEDSDGIPEAFPAGPLWMGERPLS